MVVIATNNGKKYLINLLSDFQRINFEGKISIIDTQSNDIESLNFIDSINNRNDFNLDISVYQTPTRSFDTGAYIYAINNLKSDRFYFMHDSIRIKSNDYFNEINKKLKLGVVVPLIFFNPNAYDNYDQINFCKKNFGSYEFEKGIFGPIFSIMFEDAQKIDKKYLVHPSNKNEQMAMERGWSIIFQKHNLKIDSLEGRLNPDKLMRDEYEFFKKYLPYRR